MNHSSFRYQTANEAEESLHNGNYEGSEPHSQLNQHTPDPPQLIPTETTGLYEKKGGPKLDTGLGGGIFNHPNSGYQHPLTEQRKNLDMGSMLGSPIKAGMGNSLNSLNGLSGLSVLIPGQEGSGPLLPVGPDSLLEHGSSLGGLMGLGSPGLALASGEGLQSPNGFFSPSKWSTTPTKGTTPGALASFSWASPEKVSSNHPTLTD